MGKSNNSKWVLLCLQRQIAPRYRSDPQTSMDSLVYRSSRAVKHKSPAIQTNTVLLTLAAYYPAQIQLPPALPFAIGKTHHYQTWR